MSPMWCNIKINGWNPVLTRNGWFDCRNSGVGLLDNNDNNNLIERRSSTFFTIFSLRRESSPTHTLKWPERNSVKITCNTSSAYDVRHVVFRATWYEGTAQLINLTAFKSHLSELYLTD